jgi:hypothetical protein
VTAHGCVNFSDDFSGRRSFSNLLVNFVHNLTESFSRLTKLD